MKATRKALYFSDETTTESGGILSRIQWKATVDAGVYMFIGGFIGFFVGHLMTIVALAIPLGH